MELVAEQDDGYHQNDEDGDLDDWQKRHLIAGSIMNQYGVSWDFLEDYGKP